MGLARPYGSFVPVQGRACNCCLVAGQAHARGTEHGFGSAPKLQLAIDVGEVIANRLVADASGGCDDLYRFGLADHREDVELRWRKKAGRLAPQRNAVAKPGKHVTHEV